MIPLQAPPPVSAPAQATPIRAQYGWGYAGPDGEGVGTLSLLMEPLSGRLIINVGMAAVRPAEFVIIRFSHLLQQA